MAIDTAMMAIARENQIGIWRCYGWDQPTISFGRNEQVRARFDAASVQKANMQAVRRPTGGRALLHCAEVTYSVAVPVSDTLAWREVYGTVNAVLVTALRALGVPANIAQPDGNALLKPDGPMCFDQPAPGEIMVNGAKLVGSAVWRERGAFLQHGSILVRDSQHQLHDAMMQNATRSALIPTAASLSSCLAVTPTADNVASALEHALLTFVTKAGGVSSPLEEPLWPVATLRALEKHYQDPDWLWRR